MVSIIGEDDIHIDVSLEMLTQYIINLAKRDYLNGKGRVFIEELRRLGFQDEQIERALERVKKRYKVRVLDNIILISFSKS